jgi:diaminohydroxyphosphoribosylaminopyrimidine deaminase / 5-amino-6-(5-phosphoribosylamino)uracil reductase
MSGEKDARFMGEAVMLGALCPPGQSGFSVGCVIVDSEGKLISSGYSREWGEGWHAEEIAIEKARREGKPLAGATLYSSLEPCHPRLSGKKSCVQHIIDAGIARVVFCTREPPVFVECRGEQTLKEAGLTVMQDESLKDQVVKANRALFSKSA